MRKKDNLAHLLGELSFFSWKERKTLVEETGIPRTTIYDNLRKLDNIGILEIKQEYSGKVGRPKTFFRLVG